MHHQRQVTLCICLMIILLSDASEVQTHVCNSLETTTHDNGCAILQCQFGQLVPIYEACGKEIDGNCHGVNEVFMNQNLTYQCRKIQAGNVTEFRNEVIRVRSSSCYVDGFSYVHLETMRLKRNRCEDYQCQNGVPVRIEKGCNRAFDGNCHFMGESFVKVGSTFVCASSEQDGVTKYRPQPVDPGDGRSCDFENKTYTHLQIFTRQSICGFLQCHSGTVKVLTINCMTKEALGRCYSIGQRYPSSALTFQCNLDPGNKTASFHVVNENFQDCQLLEKTYKHLEIFQDGCNTVQCVDGISTIIQGGCLWSENGKCYKLNFVWRHECTIFKCISGNNGQYHVTEI